MKDFGGRVLVIWGTQPAVRARTVARTLKLASLFGEHDMVLPTALREQPYAPVERDRGGRVVAARETHLEGAPRPDFGETNSGLFLLKSSAMFDALLDLRRSHWLEAKRRYDRPGGELGFPNEMINHLAGRAAGVMACPFADWREGQGIKTLEDVARCESYISELSAEGG
jgi:bifunctional N-acetylglucosamine-1-phosphate-uridyltransferase/glucosamine-1-phosphate-acetyltransferase GlmU-like protein